MKKKIVYVAIITTILSVTIFLSLWNMVSDNYDKQNKLILGLKKIIPRTVAVAIRDTIFIIPKLKTENKLLEIQVYKYEQGFEGTLFNEKKISSEKKKSFFI